MGEKYSEDEGAKYYSAWTQPGALTAMINYYRNLPDFFKVETWPEITVPVLVIWGKGDIALTEEHAQAGADLC